VEAGSDFTAYLSFFASDAIISGTTFDLELSFATGAYTFTYNHHLAVGVATETFESGDFSFLEWFHEGDTPWFVTDSDAHGGTYSARSGAIADDEVSRLIVYADILDDGEISFWFKTSTEFHRDYFAFYIDNRRQDWWSGENDWTYTSYAFEAGSHRFLWLYDKNGNGEDGEDCAWIDDITFPRTCTISDVEEVTEQKTNVLYPNPTTGSFTIELVEESNISIYNMLGQQIMQLGKVSGLQHFDMGNAPKGLYFIQIQNGNQTEVKKIIVE
jgi:hypothetical protein